MKIRLHWTEEYQTVRKYPAFTLDTKEYPQLELEVQNIYDAYTTGTDMKGSLGTLMEKMHNTKVECIYEDSEPASVDIISIIEPYHDCDASEEKVFNELSSFTFSGIDNDEDSGS